MRASSISGFLSGSLFIESLSSLAAPSRNAANTSGPKASDNTAPPTEEVEEKRPPI